MTLRSALLTFGCVLLCVWVGLVACPTSRAEEPGDVRIRDLEGEWKITYTNGGVRIYNFDREGRMWGSVDDQKLTGHVKRREDSLLLTFDQEDKLERLTMGVDGRLFVEHYDPKEDFPDKKPAIMGVGVRRRR